MRPDEVDTNANSPQEKNRSALVPPVAVITIAGLVRVGAAGAVAPVEGAERRAAEPLAIRADVVAARVSAVIVPAARGLRNGRGAKHEGNRKNNPGQHGISPMCMRWRPSDRQRT